MTIVIKITSKARQAFKVISLVAMYRGEDTIGKIVDENKRGAASCYAKKAGLVQTWPN